MKHSSLRRQAGASLIEILVTILILSFGMLALSGMMAYAVQMPKLSGYRATAMTLAAGHIEKMRANTQGYAAGAYDETLTFAQTVTPHVPCQYPSCAAASIAARDKFETNTLLRRELPDGGMRMVCAGACNTREGSIYVMWQEPSTLAAVDSAISDQCPNPADTPTFPPFTTAPRCIHVKFRL